MRMSKDMPFVPARTDSKNSWRLDWQNVDTVWVSKLTNLIPLVLRESPPVRVSLAELERRANQRGWIPRTGSDA